MGPERVLVALGAVAGCLGVALAAAAAHVAAGEGTLGIAAQFLLAHAPALIGLAAASAAGVAHRVVAIVAGGLIALGVAFFAGDLAHRAFRAASLFPMAAPTGGIVLMAGWAVAAASAVVGGQKRLKNLRF
ncbi:MAG: hypothetical protein JWQ36_2139 [Enterovirga sp.]|nr:hypothetical protein [Enterovirga sp.]